MNKVVPLFLTLALFGAPNAFCSSHADTLRGSNGNGRNWWSVVHYTLSVDFDIAGKSIAGSNKIDLKVTAPPTDSLQIDLQEPMVVDSVVCNNETLPFLKEGNVWWVKSKFHSWVNGTENSLTVYYHGTPRVAKNPPWDGGISWLNDSTGKDWIAVSCQGLGASVWWPCKDAQWAEPEKGMDLEFIVPKGLLCVSNGRLKSVDNFGYKNKWGWQVINPINNYDATFYIGDYITWHDTLNGENGKLDLDFYALRYHEQQARHQFAVVKQMIHCFEYWMGPYPFYEDGYKLVEAPYLGMEHQSAVAYGNKYKMGYLGSDRTGTGVGMNFDYIIVHESGHEWFGNSVTAKDIADNWVQEGITTYSESLFEECLTNKNKASEYCRGEWDNILNNTEIIGTYGINKEGSGDMYDKGAAIMYMIRGLMGNDEAFRNMLRGLSKTFYHKTVTTNEVETFITKTAKLDLTPFFNQYLRTTKIPEIEYYIKDGQFFYRFNNVVAGFSLPISTHSGKIETTLNFTSEWQHIKWKSGGFNVHFSKDFLVTVKVN